VLHSLAALFRNSSSARPTCPSPSRDEGSVRVAIATLHNDCEFDHDGHSNAGRGDVSGMSNTNVWSRDVSIALRPTTCLARRSVHSATAFQECACLRRGDRTGNGIWPTLPRLSRQCVEIPDPDRTSTKLCTGERIVQWDPMLRTRKQGIRTIRKQRAGFQGDRVKAFETPFRL
jgi:hypothetical protein